MLEEAMGGETPESNGRPVLMRTLYGKLQGSLDVHPNVRTLDHLNLGQRFLRIEATEWNADRWSLERGQVGISKDQILFLTELSDTLPAAEARIEAQQLTREAVSLSVGDCEVKGYMHVPGLLDPVMRLNQSRELFLALTAASVVGPDFEIATSFLALNPTHIAAVQTMFPYDTPGPEAESTFVTAK
jgi:hypothetical protein